MNVNLALCYSGGLDSLIAYNYAKACGYNPICIYVDLGHPYAEKEKATFKTQSKWHPEVNVIDMRTLFSLIQSRMNNQIIPSRNVMLATIGSMFAPRVWINALDGEQLGKEHDKSVRFFDDASTLLSFTNEAFQPTTIVESPFAKMSKADTIGWALNYGIPLDVLFGTASCYSGVHDKCGNCLTCVKRAIAFKKNGITEPGHEADPFESDYYKELLVEIPKAAANKDYSRFTPGRIEEFLSVLQL